MEVDNRMNNLTKERSFSFDENDQGKLSIDLSMSHELFKSVDFLKYKNCTKKLSNDEAKEIREIEIDEEEINIIKNVCMYIENVHSECALKELLGMNIKISESCEQNYKNKALFFIYRLDEKNRMKYLCQVKENYTDKELKMYNDLINYLSHNSTLKISEDTGYDVKLHNYCPRKNFVKHFLDNSCEKTQIAILKAAKKYALRNNK